MADDTNKWIDAVTKLTKLTQEGKLEWSAGSSNRLVVDDDVQRIESVFLAEYSGKRLRLFKKRFKVEQPSPSAFSAFSISIYEYTGIGREKKYPFWTSEIYLEIIDSNGHTLWTFPTVSALGDLLIAVKRQVSGVDDLLSKLAKDNGS
jgi:hypothetical protein